MTQPSNEEIAYEIDKFPNGALVRKAVVKALDEKDTQISKLEAEVADYKTRSLSCCFCREKFNKLFDLVVHSNNCNHHPAVKERDALEAKLKVAVEALETVRGQSPCDYIAWEGRQGCKVHENSHQCLAHDTLSRLKSGGTN